MRISDWSSDVCSSDLSGERERVRYQVSLKLPFLDYAPLHFIAAKHGSGLGELMEDVQLAYESTTRTLTTPELNRIIGEAVESHPPPAELGRRLKPTLSHQAGHNPDRQRVVLGPRVSVRVNLRSGSH